MFFQKFTNILYYSEKYALAQKRKVKMQIQGCVTIVLEIDTLSFLKCTLILFLPRRASEAVLSIMSIKHKIICKKYMNVKSLLFRIAKTHVLVFIDVRTAS